MFKVRNKDTRTVKMTSFCFFIGNFEHISLSTRKYRLGIFRYNCLTIYCNKLGKNCLGKKETWSREYISLRSGSWRFINADLKISQYLCLHMKIVRRRFHIKTFTFWYMRTWDMWKVCLQTFKINRTCEKVSLLFKKFINFTSKHLENS